MLVDSYIILFGFPWWQFGTHHLTCYFKDLKFLSSCIDVLAGMSAFLAKLAQSEFHWECYAAHHFALLRISDQLAPMKLNRSWPNMGLFGNSFAALHATTSELISWNNFVGFLCQNHLGQLLGILQKGTPCGTS